MGNNQSRGFGVWNNTRQNLTICLRMGATHYYENDVRPGEVFYRWPGAVWYTVHAYSTENVGHMTDSRRNWEIIKVVLFSVFTAVVVFSLVGILLYAIISKPWDAFNKIYEKLVSAFENIGLDTTREAITFLSEFLSNNTEQATTPEETRRQLRQSISATEHGCYGGGSGTWFEVTQALSSMTRQDGTQVNIVGGEMRLVRRNFASIQRRLNAREIAFTEESAQKWHARRRRRPHRDR